MKLFLETDVVINILKKKSETIDKFKIFISNDVDFFISPIVIAEIYHGANPKEYEQIEKLFSFFKVLDINAEIGYCAGEYANRYSKGHL